MISREKNKIFTVIALSAITFVSFALHVIRISYPGQPVFDEIYFATYAADYLHHEFYLDLHPPLGKLIYAAAISFAPHDSIAGAQFMSIKNVSGTSDFAAIDNHLSYDAFPYVSLRIVSALFGAALPLIFYCFLKSIRVSTIGSLLGSGMLAFENALLLQTRLILLDGMYIAFGFIALGLYFKTHSRPIAAGICWGLSLGVKLIGVVFLGPVLMGYFLTKREGGGRAQASVAKFMTAGALVCLLVISLNNFFFSPDQRFDMWYSMGLTPSRTMPIPSLLTRVPRLSQYALASVIETVFSVSSYTMANNKSFPTYSSPWYAWPFMKGGITYYKDRASVIALTGNPVVWWAATVAVGIACSMFLWWLIPHIRNYPGKGSPVKSHGSIKHTGAYKTHVILLAGYMFSLLPFLAIVRRSTFLYHYFPALIFSIGILVSFMSDILNLNNFNTLTVRHMRIISLVLIVVISGFIAAAPSTYGQNFLGNFLWP